MNGEEYRILRRKEIEEGSIYDVFEEGHNITGVYDGGKLLKVMDEAEIDEVHACVPETIGGEIA